MITDPKENGYGRGDQTAPTFYFWSNNPNALSKKGEGQRILPRPLKIEYIFLLLQILASHWSATKIAEVDSFSRADVPQYVVGILRKAGCILPPPRFFDLLMLRKTNDHNKHGAYLQQNQLNGAVDIG